MLKNIKVVDLSVTLPGPYCTQLLAYFGAEVIKVERPQSGDVMRETDPWLFENINRGKKSIVLDLKKEKDRSKLYTLVEDADVFIEGFRPGVTKRLGVDYETLREIKKDLIYCSISGFGQDGPYRNMPGHDLNYMALSGALSMKGKIEEDPIEGHVQYIPISDMAAALFASNAILAVLSSPTRKGVFIDISMLDVMVTWGAMKSEYYFGQQDIRQPNAEAHYGIFKTKDNKYVALGIIEDHFWEKLCHYFKWDDFINSTNFKTYLDRNRYAHLILPRLRETIGQYEQLELVEKLNELDIPCSPVQGWDEVIEDPHVQYRRIFREGINSKGQTYTELKIPYEIHGYELSLLSRSPKLGEHNRCLSN